MLSELLTGLYRCYILSVYMHRPELSFHETEFYIKRAQIKKQNCDVQYRKLMVKIFIHAPLDLLTKS